MFQIKHWYNFFYATATPYRSDKKWQCGVGLSQKETGSTFLIQHLQMNSFAKGDWNQTERMCKWTNRPKSLCWSRNVLSIFVWPAYVTHYTLKHTEFYSDSHKVILQLSTLKIRKVVTKLSITSRGKNEKRRPAIGTAMITSHCAVQITFQINKHCSST